MPEALSLGFDPIEDRLVLSAGRPGEAVEFHLTRRFTREFATRLAALAAESATAPPTASSAQRSKLASLHHDAIARDLPIETTRAKAPSYAPGARPALVTGVRFGRSKANPSVRLIGLRCQDGRRFDLKLPPALLHGFIEMLRRRLADTDWGIELLPPQPEVEHRSLMH